MTEKAFRRRVEDGDLLLFRGNAMMNKMQRLVTGSRFDHVGMLVRDAVGNIKLIEATGVDVLFTV